MRQIKHAVKTVFPGGGVLGKGGGIEIVARELGADIVLDNRVIRKDKTLSLLVAGKKSVEGDDHRQAHGLRQL